MNRDQDAGKANDEAVKHIYMTNTVNFPIVNGDQDAGKDTYMTNNVNFPIVDGDQNAGKANDEAVNTLT